MKLWLDDCRPAPEGYVWAKSVHEAKIYCCQHYNPLNKALAIEEISLDHDSGDYYYLGGDYINFLNWLERKSCLEKWKILTIFRIHSMNPVGVENMRRIIQKNGWREVR